MHSPEMPLLMDLSNEIQMVTAAGLVWCHTAQGEEWVILVGSSKSTACSKETDFELKNQKKTPSKTGRNVSLLSVTGRNMI